MSATQPLWRRRRRQDWEEVGRGTFDVLVIGGGISGAGIAWQAALHGLRTLLVEARDWAGGTSSRSSKLVHGGLRYLPRGEVGLVRETGHEREVLEGLWPHLVAPLPFLIPVYRRQGMPLWALGAGVWAYDRLTGVRPEHRRRLLRTGAAAALEPALETRNLCGGVRYFEAITDDARLVYTVVGAARAAGATAISRVQAGEIRLRRDTGGTVELRDVEQGVARTVRVRSTVNAAGPWAGDLDPGGAPLALARGVHLVSPRGRLPLGHAVALPSPDGGNTFAVPRGGVAYVGTTDRPFAGDPALPDVPEEDVRYLFRVLRSSLPSLDLAPRDLLAVYAGVRPLVARGNAANTRELSRRRSIEVRADGLVSVRGGKLTGFRRVAADTLRALERVGVRCGATAAPALGPRFDPAALAQALADGSGLPAETARAMFSRHGPAAADVLHYATGRKGGLSPVAAGAPLLWGEVDWTAEHEEIFDLADLLIRRTSVLWFGGLREPRDMLERVAEHLAPQLGWTGEEVSRQVAGCARQGHLDLLAQMRRITL